MKRTFDSFNYRGQPSNRNQLLSIWETKRKRKEEEERKKKAEEAERKRKEEKRKKKEEDSQTPAKTLTENTQQQAQTQSKSNERDSQFRPTTKKALVISCSQYETHTRWKPMNAPSNDGKAMVEFLQNDCDFPQSNVKYLHEANYQDFDDERKAFIETAKRLAVDQNALFFLYYSGHGTLEDGLTVGHTVKGERIPLEEFGRQLACRSNTFVICLFDCCREILPKENDSIGKGSSTSAQQYGQLCIVHGAAPSQRAFAYRNKSLSQCTDAFLSFFRSGQAGDKFPENLNQWEEGVKLGVEKTDKTYQYVCLVPSGRTSLSTSTVSTTLPNLQQIDRKWVYLFNMFDENGDQIVSEDELWKNKNFLPLPVDIRNAKKKEFFEFIQKADPRNDDNEIDIYGFVKIVEFLENMTRNTN